MPSLREKLEAFEQVEAPRARIRLSHSALDKFETCPRLYQLERVLVSDRIEIANEHFSFGHAVGAGFQSLLEHQDLERAVFDTFIAYNPMIESPEDTRKERKYFERAIMAVEQLNEEWDYDEWQLLRINNKPTTELSFKITLDDKDNYYCGYIDGVLFNTSTGNLAIVECKTTAFNLIDLSPLYRYSSQGLGYSVVLDSISGKLFGETRSLFTTLYVITQLKKGQIIPVIHVLPYAKTRLDRLNWLLGLQVQLDEIKEALRLNFFRQRPNSCYRYGRLCYQYDICNLHTWEAEQVPEVEEEKWDFVFTFEDLVRSNTE